MQPYSAPLEPVDVEVHVDQRQLRVAWSDGHRRSMISSSCAGSARARNVAAKAAPRASWPRRPRSAPQQTEIVDLRVVGRYGFTPCGPTAIRPASTPTERCGRSASARPAPPTTRGGARAD